jgi:hypothetical protein
MGWYPGRRQNAFSSLHNVRLLLGSTYIPFQWLSGDIDHLSPCTVEIKNRWMYSCPMCLHGLDRYSFVFTSFCVDFLRTVDTDRPCYIFVCTERVTETSPSRCYSSTAVGEDGCVKLVE